MRIVTFDAFVFFPVALRLFRPSLSFFDSHAFRHGALRPPTSARSLAPFSFRHHGLSFSLSRSDGLKP